MRILISQYPRLVRIRSATPFYKQLTFLLTIAILQKEFFVFEKCAQHKVLVTMNITGIFFIICTIFIFRSERRILILQNLFCGAYSYQVPNTKRAVTCVAVFFFLSKRILILQRLWHVLYMRMPLRIILSATTTKAHDQKCT